VTGLRINEALHLDRSDVDLEEGVLLIRRTKFGKSRLVPIHLTTQQALRAYGEARDQIVPMPATPAFFVSERRTRITEWSTRYTFAVVSRMVGLRPPTSGGRHGHGPRIQDLRHRFAAQTLITWHRAGIDVDRELPKLSTYLGHVHTADTYWYLEAIPELLQLAAERLTQTPPEVTPGSPRVSNRSCRASSPNAYSDSGRRARIRSPAIAIPFGCSCASPPTSWARPPPY
jgi:integrase/recombinase XerD